VPATSEGRQLKRTRATARRVAAPALPTPRQRQAFRRRLLHWYDDHGRDLPWRRGANPYQILVSEIMLQQTQVDRVLLKYGEWLEKYPSLEALAEAPIDEVVDSWYPLGYNIRPRRLHSIAREAVASYGGVLPNDEAVLLSFKGIGQYTAGAIRSFAFGERAAILDTNVARVFRRVFADLVEGVSPARRNGASAGQGGGALRRRLWTIARALVPHKRVFDFNQALMDLGATVCVARKPKCPVCPMASMCSSRGRRD
jgi:A/G-specific adenine glycosylase